MSLSDSKLVPAAFWVGFLALGFVTSLGGHEKRRPETARVQKSLKIAPAPASAIAGEMLAQGVTPAGFK